MTTIADRLRNEFVLSFPSDALDLISADPDLLTSVMDVSDDALSRLADRADNETLARLFEGLSNDRRVSLLERASTRTTLQLLNNLSDDEREDFYSQLPSSSSDLLRQVSSFPEDMAGHYMDKAAAQFRVTDSVDAALAKLRTSSVQRIRSIYVVDDLNRLAGRVDMQDIAFADREDKLSSLMNPVEGFASLTTPRDELVEIFDEYRMDSIPIVDQEHQLVGVVRYASLFLAAEESLTGDLQKMVGVSLEERALSTPLFAVKGNSALLISLTLQLFNS